ncbi:co-chaperone GroES [candidate division KSB1 bacterium]|nr:co-chaperone GroES [candidate division KSB1 bacterium]
MKKGKKEILVVGDRVLVVPDMGEERSNVGLYLPKWAVEKESVQGGRIVEVGSDIPMPNPTDIEEEPWKDLSSSHREGTIDAKVGDYVIFLRKAAIELKFDRETYLIVPYAALLITIREISKEKNGLE